MRAVLRGGAELDRDRLARGVLHLGRDRPLEDQVVERELVPAQLAGDLGGRAEDVAGRPDRLVGLLGIRDRALISPWLVGNRLRAVLAGGVGARSLERTVGERDGVGAHVGDVAVLVEPLSEAHRGLGREPQLPACLLLERRRPERRGGPPRVGLLVHLVDAEGPAFEPGRERASSILVEHEDAGRRGSGLVEVASLCDAGARDVARSHGDEPRLERPGLERPDDVPVARRHEHPPVALALDHEARGDGLDTTGRQARHDLLPEHGRHLEAVEPVEDAPRLLRVDEALVDVAGLLQGLPDRVARDLVEHHPPDRDLRLQHLAEMPRDRLALAVLVRREQQLVRAAQLLPEIRDDALLVGVDDVERVELVIDVDAELSVTRPLLLRHVRRAVRQVTDVPDARLHDEVTAEIAGDRPGLRRRLDDDETGHVAEQGNDDVAQRFSGSRAYPPRG